MDCSNSCAPGEAAQSFCADLLYSTITVGVVAGAMTVGATVCGSSLLIAAAAGAIGIAAIAAGAIPLATVGACFINGREIKNSIYVVHSLGAIAVPIVALAMGILPPLGALLAVGVGVSAMLFVTSSALACTKIHEQEVDEQLRKKNSR